MHSNDNKSSDINNNSRQPTTSENDPYVALLNSIRVFTKEKKTNTLLIRTRVRTTAAGNKVPGMYVYELGMTLALIKYLVCTSMN